MMRQNIVWIVGGATLALGVIFLIPSGSNGTTSYDPLAGKDWTLTTSASEASTPAATSTDVAASTASAQEPATIAASRPILSRSTPQATPRSIIPSRSRREPGHSRIARARRASHTLEPHAAPTPPVASSSTTAVAAPPSTPSGAPQYSLEDVPDKYEADESKFPLDRIVTSEGVTLGLLGLERLEGIFVLKVAVANEGAADFFVKGFSIAAARQDLVSHAIFRILVEPRRTREGYVVFAKPPTGAVVHIKLQEDGGRGRALDAAIPYPF